jgi:hypothetical protein
VRILKINRYKRGGFYETFFQFFVKQKNGPHPLLATKNTAKGKRHSLQTANCLLQPFFSNQNTFGDHPPALPITCSGCYRLRIRYGPPGSPPSSASLHIPPLFGNGANGNQPFFRPINYEEAPCIG